PVPLSAPVQLQHSPNSGEHVGLKYPVCLFTFAQKFAMKSANLPRNDRCNLLRCSFAASVPLNLTILLGLPWDNRHPQDFVFPVPKLGRPSSSAIQSNNCFTTGPSVKPRAASMALACSGVRRVDCGTGYFFLPDFT